MCFALYVNTDFRTSLAVSHNFAFHNTIGIDSFHEANCECSVKSAYFLAYAVRIRLKPDFITPWVEILLLSCLSGAVTYTFFPKGVILEMSQGYYENWKHRQIRRYCGDLARTFRQPFCGNELCCDCWANNCSVITKKESMQLTGVKKLVSLILDAPWCKR